MPDDLNFLILIVVLFLLVLTVLWVILPFAIFGTKPRIDQGNKLAHDTNYLLSEIGKELEKQTAILQRMEAIALGDEARLEELYGDAPAEPARPSDA